MGGAPSSPDSSGDASSVDSRSYLFSDVELKSALEELREVYLKKMRGLRSSEAQSMEERLTRAYAIAEGCLLKVASSGERGDTQRWQDVEN